MIIQKTRFNYLGYRVVLWMNVIIDEDTTYICTLAGSGTPSIEAFKDKFDRRTAVRSFMDILRNRAPLSPGGNHNGQ